MERIVEQNSKYREQNADDKEKSISEEQFKVLRKWFNNSSQLRRIDEIIRWSQVSNATN